MIRLYTQLSIHAGFDKFASYFYSFFVGAYLYSQGWSITYILLFYITGFAIRGFVHLTCPYFLKKFKIIKTIIISYFALTMFFIGFMIFDSITAIIIVNAIFHSIGRGLYYPIMHLFKSVYVDNNHRGRFYALETIIIGVFAALAAWLGSILLEWGIIFAGLGAISSMTIGIVVFWKTIKRFPHELLENKVPCTIRETFKSIRDRKSTRLNSSHIPLSRMPSSA